MHINAWNCVLELDRHRAVASGDPAALSSAIRRGAELRVQTAFRHNEHIDVTSDNPELIDEVMDFRVTYLLDDRWTAGILNLRQPVELPSDFMPRPSMSFFMYNEDAGQAIGRPYLDGLAPAGEPGPSPAEPPANMPKYHVEDAWDEQTNAPSSNFVFDFEKYRFIVRDDWNEMASIDTDGSVASGSIAELVEAFRDGQELKVAIAGLGDDLVTDGEAIRHEIFVHAGSSYHYTEQQLLIAQSQPVVRVRPTIPLRYTSQGWDFGWLLIRADGRVVYRRCDPYTLQFSDIALQRPVRWFAR